jgi:hypothetical protein
LLKWQSPEANASFPIFLHVSVSQLWSAGGFGRKSIAKIVSDIEGMKNKPIHVCAKTAFVG